MAKPEKLYNVGGLNNCPTCRFALAAYVTALEPRTQAKAQAALKYHLHTAHHLPEDEAARMVGEIMGAANA